VAHAKPALDDRALDEAAAIIAADVEPARHVSPLWKIHTDSWRASYTTDLLDLLNVLGLFIELESTQTELLEAVAQQSLWTAADLTAEGVLLVTASQPPISTYGESTLF
jgi:hypothetical protein